MDLIPANLQSDAFKKIWLDWENARREDEKPLTKRAATEQIATLSKLTEAVAIATLKESMRNQWTGLYPRKDQQPKKKKKDYRGI